MTINLSAEDQEKAEAFVASGRFSTLADVMHAGLKAIEEDSEWQGYARERIEQGLDDVAAGRTAPAEEVLGLMESYSQRKA